MRSPEDATQRELEFTRSFEARLRSSESVPNPLDGRRYRVPGGRCARTDRLPQLVRALKARGRFSRGDASRFPLSRAVSLRLARRLSLYEVLLVGASATRFESYLEREGEEAERPLGADACRRVLGRFPQGPRTFAAFGVFSASGWRGGVLEELEGAPCICLVAPEPGGTWRVASNVPGELQEYRWFFDPEGEEGRLDRLVSAIRERAELKVAGGFIAVADLASAYGIDAPLLPAVLSRVAEPGGRLAVVEVGGVSIVKHMRA